MHNYYYYRMFKQSLMLQKEGGGGGGGVGRIVMTFEQNGDVYIFLILPKYHVFHLILPFRGYRRYLHVSQKTK